MANDNSRYGHFPGAIQRLILRVKVRNELIKLWGPESQWPILWLDIQPSLAVWLHDECMSADAMVNNILRAAVILRAEGVID